MLLALKASNLGSIAYGNHGAFYPREGSHGNKEKACAGDVNMLFGLMPEVKRNRPTPGRAAAAILLTRGVSGWILVPSNEFRRSGKCSSRKMNIWNGW
jgi:hypothetical protein